MRRRASHPLLSPPGSCSFSHRRPPARREWSLPQESPRRPAAVLGRPADGMAGSAMGKMCRLHDHDCPPAHFAHGRLNTCGTTWARPFFASPEARAPVPATTRAQAPRRAAIRTVTPPTPASVRPRSVISPSKPGTNGFNGFFRPRYPGHGDHTHVEHRSTRFRSVSGYGI